MRIITRDLHRAFPELDRFDDARARAFVEVAQTSLSARTLRWTAMAFMSLLISAIVIYVSTLLLDRLHRPSFAREVSAVGLLLVVGLSIVSLVAMLTRDYMLRRRIHRLISRRGTCPKCSYSLLGMPVGPDLVVTCPECGTQTTADPAMNELAPATTDGGHPTFAPSGLVESAALTAERRRRRRVIIKWVFFALGGIIGLAALTFGAWRGWLWSMARQARADRNFTALALAHAESGLTTQARQQSNQWPAVVRMLEAWRNDNEQFVQSEAPKLVDSVLQSNAGTGMELTYIFGDFESLYLPPEEITGTPPEDQGAWSPVWRQQRRVLARALLKHAAEKGHIEAFKLLQTVEHAVRDMPLQFDSPASQVLLPELGYCRYFTRMSAARMEVAIESGDRAEYLAALDQSLALARILDKQITLIDRLVASAIEAQMLSRVRFHASLFPDDAWRAEVSATIKRRTRTMAVDFVIKGERLMARDTVAWYFSDVRRVESAMLFGDTVWSQMTAGMASAEFDRLGTYAENLAVVEERTQLAIDNGKLPRYKRSPAAPVPASRQTILADIMFAFVQQVLGSEDVAQANARGVLIMLALESARARTGRYPDSLVALAAADPSLNLTDPCSGRPLGYRLLATSEQESDQRGYLLWSTGFDATDDLGKDTPELGSRGYNWSQSGTDVIFNQPKP